MIIGINTGHDAAFVLINTSGNVRYILEEERFNRVKHTGFSTHLSLSYLIDNGLINPNEVTDLVFGFEMEDHDITALMEKCYQNVVSDFDTAVLNDVLAYSKHPFAYTLSMGFGTSIDMYAEIDRLKRLFPKAKISSYKHHLCHAASAYYPSGFSNAAIIIADGSGRLETLTVWQADENEISLIKQIELPHSLGIFYWLFSSYVNLEEGKFMGLASYGNPVYEEFICQEVLEVKTNGDFKFKVPLVFWFDMDSEYAISQIERLFGIKRRASKEAPIKQFHADVAASVQSVLEHIILKIASHTRQVTGSENLCLAGGVFQNCVANGKIVKQNIFKNVWIQPMANDSGVALGAALTHFYQKKPDTDFRWKMNHAYYGIGYPTETIQSILEELKFTPEKKTRPTQFVAEEISKGKIIAIFDERSEVGPRALGHRSIVSDPRYKLNHFTVNHIKRRESWRPLAPSIIKEKMADYFNFSHDAPFMILSFDVEKDIISKVPAVIHVDGTSRPQTVDARQGAYYSLLSEFYNLTNIPILSNTSFNIHDDPIVQHPIDALRDALVSEIDILLLNDLILSITRPGSTILKALRQNKYPSLYYEYFKNTSEVYILKPTIRKTEDVEVLFSWLGINFRFIDHSKLEEMLKTRKAFDLITDSPYLLNDLTSNEVIQNKEEHHQYIFILEKSGFLSKQDFSDLSNTLKNIISHLNALFSQKELIIFSNAKDGILIEHQLNLMGFKSNKIICSQTELSNYHLQKNTDFIIATREYIDKYNSSIRKAGFISGEGYILWEI